MKNKVVIGIAIFIPIMALVYAGIELYSGYIIRSEIDRTIRETPSIVDIDYEKISFHYFRSELQIKGLSVKLVRPAALLKEGSKSDAAAKGVLKVDEIRIHRYLVEKGFPTDIYLEANGVRLDTTRYPFRQLNPYLQEMGYKHITGHITCEYTYHPKQKTLDLKQLQIHAREFGTFEGSIHLNNIHLPQMISNSNDTLYLLTQLPAISIAEAQFFYQDDVLLKRLYHLNIGRSKRPFKDTVLGATRRMEAAIEAEETATTRRALQAVIDFLHNPKKIRIRVRPEKPISLGRLIWIKKPGELIELLGAEIEDK